MVGVDMNKLDDEVREFINSNVSSGQYNDFESIINESLLLLIEFNMYKKTISSDIDKYFSEKITKNNRLSEEKRKRLRDFLRNLIDE
jgi:Arc/MetJ-type ribon-helix-helix transcriptional regulator